jgi:hypothetical protein
MPDGIHNIDTSQNPATEEQYQDQENMKLSEVNPSPAVEEKSLIEVKPITPSSDSIPTNQQSSEAQDNVHDLQNLGKKNGYLTHREFKDEKKMGVARKSVNVNLKKSKIFNPVSKQSIKDLEKI